MRELGEAAKELPVVPAPSFCSGFSGTSGSTLSSLDPVWCRGQGSREDLQEHGWQQDGELSFPLGSQGWVHGHVRPSELPWTIFGQL